MAIQNDASNKRDTFTLDKLRFTIWGEDNDHRFVLG